MLLYRVRDYVESCEANISLLEDLDGEARVIISGIKKRAFEE